MAFATAVAGAAVNAALIVATVIHGSHYVTDVFAGAALTVLVIAIFSRCCIVAMPENRTLLHAVRQPG